jgi:hypothetical protein
MALKPLEVKTSNIATYAVTESRIAKNAVTVDKIADGNVTETKLKDGAVTTNKIKDKSITGAKIADATIPQNKLILPIVVPSPITRPISPPVETAEIKDGAITRPKLAVAAVETDNIKDLNVTGVKLISSAVTTPKIADSAVTEAKLATDAVTTPKIKDGSVTPEKLSFVPGVGVGKFESALLHIQDRKEYGVQGGDFVAGLPRTRDLNTVLTNEIAGASLSNNQITLPAGKYYIEASAPAFMVHGHKAALYDPVNLVYRVEGTSECSCFQATYAQTRSFVSGRFELIAKGVLELVHQGQQTEMADGFGVPASAFGNEIYTDVKIWKID